MRTVSVSLQNRVMFRNYSYQIFKVFSHRA